MNEGYLRDQADAALSNRGGLRPYAAPSGTKKEIAVLLNSNDICVVEITAFEQHRFTRFFGKRVSKAVAEIQLGRMPTASSKISVGVARDLRLNLRDRVNGDARFANEIIKAPRGYRIAAGIDHNGRFNKIDRTEPADRCIGNCSRTGRCLWFIAKDGNDRRRVDNHFGSPRSS